MKFHVVTTHGLLWDMSIEKFEAHIQPMVCASDMSVYGGALQVC